MLEQLAPRALAFWISRAPKKALACMFPSSRNTMHHVAAAYWTIRIIIGYLSHAAFLDRRD